METQILPRRRAGNSFVLEGERMLEICSTFDSRALSCTSALLQTLKAQVVSQEKTRGALRGAFEILQRHQRDTDTRQRRVQLERSSLLRCDLLNAARESAAVKVFHGVQDLEARNLNHSLTNWIACLRNTMVREHVLRRCQENKTSCKKMPLMRFPDDGTTPHACGNTKKTDTWECTPSDVPHLHDDIFLVRDYKIVFLDFSHFFRVFYPIDDELTRAQMQNEYDHVTRVNMSSGKEKKEMYNAVKVSAEALRKLQAIKNREYLQKRRTKVEKRKEIVADRTRQQDRAANDENPRQRKKKKVNDEKGTLDVFASIVSSCDS